MLALGSLQRGILLQPQRFAGREIAPPTDARSNERVAGAHVAETFISPIRIRATWPLCRAKVYRKEMIPSCRIEMAVGESGVSRLRVLIG